METWLNLKRLVKWKELGLAPAAGGEMGAGPGSPSPPTRDCFKVDLQTTFYGCTNTSEPLHIIHLILLFKENFKGSTMTVQDRLDLLNRVRQEFPHICTQQLSRIQKIIHDTLAKLLGSSRPARKDREAIMKSAVPSIKSSLHKIISHSANDTFRRRCFDALQADTCMELTDQLSDHLNVLCERPNSQHRNFHSQSAVGSQGQFPCEGDDEDGGKVPSDDFNLASSSSSCWMPQEIAQETVLTEENEDDADFDLLDETRPPPSDSVRVSQCGVPAMTSEARLSSSRLLETRNSAPQFSEARLSSSSLRPSETRQSALQFSETMLSSSKFSETRSSSSSSKFPQVSHPGSNKWTSVSPSSAEERKKRSLERWPSAQHSSEARIPSSSELSEANTLASSQWTSCPSTLLSSEILRQYQTCDGDSKHTDGMSASSGKPEARPVLGDAEEDGVKDNDVQVMQEHLAGEVGNDWFETLMDHDDWVHSEI
nr:uncharacterized protein LOC129264120 [Lytechinus pictus]